MRLQQQAAGVAVGRRKEAAVRVARAARAQRWRSEPLVFLLTEMGGAPGQVPHVHTAVFDANGYGRTNEVLGHRHEIRGLELLRSENGHTHELSTLRDRRPRAWHYRLLREEIVGGTDDEEDPCED